MHIVVKCTYALCLNTGTHSFLFTIEAKCFSLPVELSDYSFKLKVHLFGNVIMTGTLGVALFCNDVKLYILKKFMLNLAYKCNILCEISK